jgi:predicted TIM-barrel fold metal-dependent hydrolase
MRDRSIVVSVCLLLAIAPMIARAQVGIDEDLLKDISAIKAIDNHAHPLKYVAAGQKPDNEYDALPVEAVPPFPLPFRIRETNPEFIRAWKELYGYPYNDRSPAHLKELMASKQRVLDRLGENFPAWVLDRVNIETMFANRVAMGEGLIHPRFRWVAFDDALLFPLSNKKAKAANPDYNGFYPGVEKLLKRYIGDLGLSTLPSSLDLYLKTIVTPTLERQKKAGAVAIKFEAAYLRKLDFNNPDRTIASATYARFAAGGEPRANDYKILQDFLFYYLAREAGRLGMAVHIHCFSGVGSFYDQSGSNPLLLQSVFNDSSLRKTNFVLLHGGYPFTKEVSSLMSKPNVYGDFSLQTLITYPRELSETLRNWLEMYPEKILFGTDAFSLSPEIDWEVVTWLSNNSTRRALALALTGMINDGEIDRAKAMEMARMALHDNAAGLYGTR